MTEHNGATIQAAAQVAGEVRTNIRELAGFAVAWPKIAQAVGLPVEVCRCICGLSPTPKPNAKPVLPWTTEARQSRLFDV